MAKLARHLTLMHEIAGSNPSRCFDFFFFFAWTFLFMKKNVVLKELMMIIHIFHNSIIIFNLSFTQKNYFFLKSLMGNPRECMGLTISGAIQLS